MIPKKDMETFTYYVGSCRNTNVAMWDHNKKKFLHIRNKYGHFFVETIDHFEDVKETGFDGFIPMRKLEIPSPKEISKEKVNVGYYKTKEK